MGIGYILQILSYIPLINYLIATITFLFTKSVIFDYSIIQVFVFGLVVYMAVVSLLGRLPRVYWVSGIIDRQV
jgi:hypothetical protein